MIPTMPSRRVVRAVGDHQLERLPQDPPAGRAADERPAVVLAVRGRDAGVALDERVAAALDHRRQVARRRLAQHDQLVAEWRVREMKTVAPSGTDRDGGARSRESREAHDVVVAHPHAAVARLRADQGRGCSCRGSPPGRRRRRTR